MKFKIGIILFFLFFVTSSLVAQNAYNKFDSNGERHGKWKGLHKDGVLLRYTGQFEHGKEVGVFRYFDKLNGKSLVATREFNSANKTCFVVFYSGKSKVSEGMMIGREHSGEWRYFHKKSPNIMSLEYYRNGKLDGVRKVFYLDGTLAEQVNYKEGEKNGVGKQFNKGGVLIESATFSMGVLNGPITYYESDGTISIDGQYQDDRAVGVWSYYKNAKKFKEEIKGRSRYKKR